MTADAPGRVRGTGTHTARSTAPRDFGPFDAEDLPEPDPETTDPVGVVDFGAVRVPVPADGSVTVEPTAGGRLQAVHVSLPGGRLSVSALAAPKSARLWPELAAEIDTSLRDGGARVRSFRGEWGRELHARTGAADSVFIGVDGARWMLYGVATGPTAQAPDLDAALRVMLRGTVVVRGRSPYPVRTVLPLVVPDHLQGNAVAGDTAVASGPAAVAEPVGSPTTAIPVASPLASRTPSQPRHAAPGPPPVHRAPLVAADATQALPPTPRPISTPRPVVAEPLTSRQPVVARSVEPVPPVPAVDDAPVPLWAAPAADRAAADFGVEPAVGSPTEAWTRRPAQWAPTTRPGAAPNVTAPHETAPHETAPHETAPHETAPDDGGTATTEWWPAVVPASPGPRPVSHDPAGDGSNVRAADVWAADVRAADVRAAEVRPDDTPLHDELPPTRRWQAVPAGPGADPVSTDRWAAVPDHREPDDRGAPGPPAGGGRHVRGYPPGEGRRHADEPVDLSVLVRERPGRRRARYGPDAADGSTPEGPPSRTGPSEPATAPLPRVPTTGRHGGGRPTPAVPPEPDRSRTDPPPDGSVPALAFLEATRPEGSGPGRHHRPS